MTGVALDLSGICKKYPNGPLAVDNLNLQVKDGDFYALLGPNGAGKSTTIGIITSLVNKTAGDVTIFGYNLDNQTYRAKRLLGLVPQEFNFNPFESVMQIVVNQAGYYGIGLKEARRNAEEYLRLLQLWDKRGSGARQLSGGMKRRLMIARALVHKPKLLILDEPTAGVDIEVRRSMWDFLRQLNEQGITIILTTHYLEEAEMLCRNIGIINQGKLIANTSMKRLLATLQSEALIFDFYPVEAKPELPGYHSRLLDLGSIEVVVKRKQGLNSLFNYFEKQQINVLSMRNKANRLEELFVSLIKKKKEQE